MDKRDLPLAAACVLVLVLYFVRVANTPTPPPETNPGISGSDTSVTVVEDQPVVGEPPISPDPSVTTTTDTPPETEPPEPAEVEGPEIAAGFAKLAAAERFDLTREDVSTLHIDPEAGGIREVTVYQHKNEARDGPIKLGSVLHPMYTVQSGANEWRFTSAKVIEDDGNTYTIERAIKGTPLVLQQSWSFPEGKDSYRMDYSVKVRNPGDRLYHTKTLRLNCGVMSALDTAQGFFGAGGMDQRVDIVEAGEEDPDWHVIQKVQKQDSDDKAEFADMPIDWIAVQNKYFASVIVPNQRFTGVNMRVIEGPDEEGTDLITAEGLLERVAIGPGETASWEFTCYLGAKDFDQLEAMGQNQEKIMQFDLFVFFHVGWMVPISKLIKTMLMLFAGMLHNYGVAVVLLTLMVRTFFWPVTHRTTVFSRQMQKLAPEMKALREKYKDNPQVMQEKTFALYREHKMNPLMGCLPVLLQIPVFFALFNVLRNAVELRQQSFLWVNDLSQPDTIFEVFGLPINPLAVMMGVTMFIQQSMVPTSADPMQQRMMKFMSIFIVFICYTLPSGLTLYWATSNCISIFQYRITHGREDKEKKKADAAAAAAQESEAEEADAESAAAKPGGGKRKKKKKKSVGQRANNDQQS